MQKLKVSLVVPVRNEADSIEILIESIGRQTVQPDEIVLVDGGSFDTTVAIVERIAAENAKLKLVTTGGATPGKGRNLGIAAARNEWIALTDAGIKLDETWLEELINASGGADIVYGNYSPITDTFFTRCAAQAYVPPQGPDGIRGKFIASSLLKRQVWEAVGGFPDLRAAEDLFFMEQAERAGFKVKLAPKAMVHWQLRHDARSTFHKFALYSKHNVWAGRQWDWHYGLLKQYLALLPFLLLAIFHSWWWLAALPLCLSARVAKRILMHRFEFGLAMLVNPISFWGIGFIVILIDAATFIGWVHALRRTTPSAELPSSNKEGS
jgi:glycosyltransferase involved in cell wall biosynthesis